MIDADDTGCEKGEMPSETTSSERDLMAVNGGSPVLREFPRSMLRSRKKAAHIGQRPIWAATKL